MENIILKIPNYHQGITPKRDYITQLYGDYMGLQFFLWFVTKDNYDFVCLHSCIQTIKKINIELQPH